MYPGQYQLIGNEMSFFSRKLEAQLRFQQIDWHWQFKTMEIAPEIEARAGTHFIPVLRTPDKWLIHDTIAIGPMLNDRFAEHPVIPATPVQRASCFILEDAFNHWLGRHAVHSRWCYEDNVTWVGLRFGANMVLDRSIDEPLSEAEREQLAGIGPMMNENFGKSVCESLGAGPDQADAMQADFKALLAVLDSHLAEHAFLLGPRPCLADFALAGAVKAHFITDPTPISWLGSYRERLETYTQACFRSATESAQQWLADDSIAESLQPLLDYLQGSYYRSAKASVSAALAGEKYYDLDYGYGPVKARSQRRLDLARQHVKNEIQRSGAADQPALEASFGQRGILEYYLA